MCVCVRVQARPYATFMSAIKTPGLSDIADMSWLWEQPLVWGHLTFRSCFTLKAHVLMRTTVMEGLMRRQENGFHLIWQQQPAQNEKKKSKLGNIECFWRRGASSCISHRLIEVMKRGRGERRVESPRNNTPAYYRNTRGKEEERRERDLLFIENSKLLRLFLSCAKVQMAL